jgi:hypothetical protein
MIPDTLEQRLKMVDREDDVYDPGESREVPFDPEAICDICGKKGAFDLMGDLYCGDCLDAIMPVEDDGEEDIL